jgi:hypothetical protein
MSNNRMIDKLEWDLEGTCLDINEILPQHFAGGTEVSHRKNE